MNNLDTAGRLLVPNDEVWHNFSTISYFSDRQLAVKTLEQGVILPPQPAENDPFKCNGGVCDQDLNFVDGHNDIRSDPWRGNYVIQDAYPVDPENIDSYADEVIYGGALICHFGHFITESLSRLWFVTQNPELDNRIVFIMMKVNSMQIIRHWIFKIFDLLGISEDRIIIIDKPARFQTVLVPEQSLYFREYFTSEFTRLYQTMLTRVRPSTAKKIFLSRSPELISMVHLCNQEYFEDFYRQHGFTVVYPEKLSVIDQISIVSGADEIVTYIGTLSHWALFCRPGTKFTMLTRADSSRDFLQTIVRQCLINEAAQIDWRVVSIARNFLFAAHGLGVCLLGSTPYWQRYVLDEFNEQVDPNEPLEREIVDDYVHRWCKFFSKEVSLPCRIESIHNLRRENQALERQIELGRPVLCCETRMESWGWQPPMLEGDVCGEPEEQLTVQAIRLRFFRPFVEINYAVYYSEDGWTESVAANRIAGTPDEDKPINGFRIWLNSEAWSIRYRAHIMDGDWSGWSNDGGAIISTLLINALQIEIVPRGE